MKLYEVVVQIGDPPSLPYKPMTWLVIADNESQACAMAEKAIREIFLQPEYGVRVKEEHEIPTAPKVITVW